MDWTEVIGWIGAGLIISAYFLVSTKKVPGTDLRYQGMNFLGALGVGINAYYHSAWPSLGIQVVWALIALYAILQFFFLFSRDKKKFRIDTEG